MNEQYEIQKRKIIKRFIIMFIVSTIVIGGAAYYAWGNCKKAAEGAKDLKTMDISESKGEFVKASFDKINHHFAEYVTERKNGNAKYTNSRLYFYAINDKMLVVQVPGDKFLEFDKLANFTNAGSASSVKPIECNGKMISMKSEIKDLVKDILEEELGSDNMSEEEINEFVWPYVMDTDIAVQLGVDNSSKVIKYLGGIYGFIILMFIVSTFSNLSKLKRYYSNI
jgi:hypothetical protein